MGLRNSPAIFNAPVSVFVKGLCLFLPQVYSAAAPILPGHPLSPFDIYTLRQIFSFVDDFMAGAKSKFQATLQIKFLKDMGA